MCSYNRDMKNKKINIIGAGLTGLVAGYELSKKGYQVEIFERSGDIGGLMGGFKIGGTSLEKAYHHIFKTDKYIIGLIKELGLAKKLKWHPEKTGLYFGDKIYPFMGAIDLLKFSPLDLVSKVRLGLVKIWLEKDNNWEKYRKITAKEWMKKWCGKNAYRVIWEPLLKGKFHQDYDKVSMAWLWARIHTRANSDGTLGYLDGGFQQIADELAKNIKKNGGKIHLNSEYTAKENNIPTIYTGSLKEINYLGAICLVFTSNQSLSSYYWHNINDTKSPFLAFIQHTNLVDKAQYGGKEVYYLGTYVPNNHRFFGEDEKKIEKEFFEYLNKIFPKFDKNLIKEKWLFRLKNAQHIVGTDYVVPKYKVGKNLYQANFAQIFPEDRGTNFSVREGKKIARMVSGQKQDSF